MIDGHELTMEYLKQFADKHGIRIIWDSHGEPYDLPASDSKRNAVIMNMNWHDVNDLCRHLSHEMSHVIHGDSTALYEASDGSKARAESDADKLAAIILMRYYFEEIPESEWNVDQFMHYYNIPAYLRDHCVRVAKDLCKRSI
ncbi:hypothetical protein [Lactobacillus hominis]|uniref:IrrE N-terminal-like domain-containing protein n=1 Tax=Lactobacillus hominis DSM 23910 = CRBIP 24.179 TaxID=1423758 RepID=I7JUP3_9LACO|nr:hypothetical protein [Lactobacillus hominis]KRM85880.1 hypothetical protein FC41_GL000072 [Lactobacillus hominis DSM 23910 = CRBIP 24.179]MCT3348885.1 hypothetical protein [Lactobacillus hominis]CCI81566.1 Putative uncharacterized protein ps104 [Lactobacillus hominis DSM 23910 = CRBIP 24.179]